MMVGLLKRDYNAKITKMEGKIPSIFGLVTSIALTAVGNKMLLIQRRKQIKMQKYQT